VPRSLLATATTACGRLVDGDGASPEADPYDGGECRNTLSYRGRAAGVTVDLTRGAQAPGGSESGEADVVARIQRVEGTSRSGTWRIRLRP
jgi:hypothetical protein